MSFAEEKTWSNEKVALFEPHQDCVSFSSSGCQAHLLSRMFPRDLSLSYNACRVPRPLRFPESIGRWISTKISGLWC